MDMGCGGTGWPRVRARRAWIASTVALALAGFGCNAIMDLGRFTEAPVDAGDEPETGGRDAGIDASGIDASGIDASGPWGCLALPSETTSPSVQATVGLIGYAPASQFTSDEAVDGGSYLTLATYTAVPGVQVQACPGGLYVNCENAIATETTDDAGAVTFTLPQNFGGFYQLTGGGVLPQNVYPGRLLASASTDTYPVAATTPQDAQLLAQFFNASLDLSPDSGVGILQLGVTDCEDHAAGGVVFTLSTVKDDTIVFYLSDGVPSPTATATDDQLGAAGVFNAPAGQITVTATLGPSTPLGTASIVLGAGGITSVDFRMRAH